MEKIENEIETWVKGTFIWGPYDCGRGTSVSGIHTARAFNRTNKQAHGDASFFCKN